MSTFSISDIMKQLQDAQTQANTANQTRYDALLKSLGDLGTQVGGTYGQASNLLANTGQTELTRLGEQTEQSKAAANQNLVGRGLGNTTIMDTTARGIQSDADLAAQSINEGVAKQQAGILTQQAGSQLQLGQTQAQAMESMNQNGPNMGVYGSLIQAASRGANTRSPSTGQAGIGTGDSTMGTNTKANNSLGGSSQPATSGGSSSGGGGGGVSGGASGSGLGSSQPASAQGYSGTYQALMNNAGQSYDALNDPNAWQTGSSGMPSVGSAGVGSEYGDDSSDWLTQGSAGAGGQVTPAVASGGSIGAGGTVAGMDGGSSMGGQGGGSAYTFPSGGFMDQGMVDAYYARQGKVRKAAPGGGSVYVYDDSNAED